MDSLLIEWLLLNYSNNYIQKCRHIKLPTWILTVTVFGIRYEPVFGSLYRQWEKNTDTDQLASSREKNSGVKPIWFPIDWRT